MIARLSSPEAAAPVGIHFELVSTWAPDFVAAIHRHYTRSRGAPFGKKLAWRIFEGSQLVGWIGLGEPSFKLAPRRTLGLEDARPAPDTVSCYIYRLESAGRTTSAACILRLWHPQAVRDWQERYGRAPVHFESMVGQGDEKVMGACFRSARWRALGWTTGRSARRPAGATHGACIWSDDQPKLVFYLGPLKRVASHDVQFTRSGETRAPTRDRGSRD